MEANVYTKQGSQNVPSGPPMGQVTFPCHLSDEKAVCQLSHTKESKTKHAIALSKQNLRANNRKEKLEFKYFPSLVKHE